MITLTTWATPYFRDGCLDLCRASIDAMVALQSNLYHFIPDVVSRTRHPSWAKLDVLLSQCNAPTTKNCWVVWLDADSVILNPRYPVDFWLNHLPEEVNVVTAHDWNGICCSFIAVRQVPWSYNFLSTAKFIGTLPGEPKWEQTYFKWFFANAVEHQHRLYLAPTDVASDATLSSELCHFVYHVGGHETVKRQQAILAGQKLGGMPHGIEYIEYVD